VKEEKRKMRSVKKDLKIAYTQETIKQNKLAGKSNSIEKISVFKYSM
jgi:hypothetical protein